MTFNEHVQVETGPGRGPESTVAESTVAESAGSSSVVSDSVVSDSSGSDSAGVNPAAPQGVIESIVVDGGQEMRGGSGLMFDRIAPRYDMLNRVLSFGADRSWRRRAVRSMVGDRGEDPVDMLDLATGTGDLALEMTRQFPEGTVVGVDPSVEMLRVGYQKLRQLDLTERVELRQGDAQALPFRDDSFDGVGIAFGIRNVPDRSLALGEMARVTRPGGRVVILELSEPRLGWVSGVARGYIHHVVPRLGALISGAAEYRYLERSIAAFPPVDAFASLMESSGLEVVACHPLWFGSCTLFVGRPSPSATRRPDASDTPVAESPAHESLAHESLAHESLAHESLAHESLAHESPAQESPVHGSPGVL